MSIGNTIFKVMLPGIIIIIVITISVIMVMAKPEPEKKQAVEIARNIRVVTAQSGRVVLSVKTQGTVQAKQQIDLVPQVSGQVVYVSDKFVSGGLFKKGELILRLEPRDYQYQVTAAESRVTESRQVLVREQAEGALAKSEWDLLGHGEATDLTLRKPQLADASAKLMAAEANLKVAILNLERTEIRAPFNGLLTTKNVDLGQYLSPGTNIGRFLSTDVLEVRLPMSSNDLAQFNFAGLQSGKTTLDVTLRGRLAGHQNHWKGKIVRTEGLIDSKTRIIYVVAELRGNQRISMDGKTPISIGQFVSAEVEGRVFESVFQLPRDVLRQGNSVLVVDENNKLQTRTVQVVESNRDFVVISGGLEDGDIICKSQLGVDVDGLLVKFDRQEGEPS